MRVGVIPILPRLPRAANGPGHPSEHQPSLENPFHRSDGAEMALSRSPKGICVGLCQSNITASAGGCLSPRLGIKLKPNHALVGIVPSLVSVPTNKRWLPLPHGFLCDGVAAMRVVTRGQSLASCSSFAATLRPARGETVQKPVLESQRAWGQLCQCLVQ